MTTGCSVASVRSAAVLRRDPVRGPGMSVVAGKRLLEPRLGVIGEPGVADPDRVAAGNVVTLVYSATAVETAATTPTAPGRAHPPRTQPDSASRCWPGSTLCLIAPDVVRNTLRAGGVVCRRIEGTGSCRPESMQRRAGCAGSSVRTVGV
jgi:hypothetical protein